MGPEASKPAASEQSALEAFESPVPAAHLKGFKLVWYDPRVNSKENQGYQAELVKLFAECKFCDKSETAIKEFSGPFMQVPIVVVSNGRNYEDIKVSAQGANQVCGILIFCHDLARNQHYKEECKKVLAVSRSFRELRLELKKVHMVNQRIRRFFEVREEQTFYTLKDAVLIKSGLSQKVENEVCTVFFPIGVRGVKISSILTPTKLDEIMMVARNDALLAPCLDDIQDRIDSLKRSLDLQTVLLSYTANGLRNILDLYIGYGDYEGFKLFREYLFCLKGSLIELGEPLSTETHNLYRGMWLKEKDLKKWVDVAKSEDVTDRYGLFPSFTSATTDESVAKSCMAAQQGLSSCNLARLCLSVVDSVEPFSDFLRRFEFAEEYGVFYPCDISGHSTYKEEREVLFPPFYPFRIKSVEKVHAPFEVVNINIEVPRTVCLSNVKNSTAKFMMDLPHSVWAEAYVDKACDLAVKGLSSDLSFCKKDVAGLGKVPVLLKALEQSQGRIKKFGLDHEENITREDLNKILQILAMTQSKILSILTLCSTLSGRLTAGLCKALGLCQVLRQLDISYNKVSLEETRLLAPALGRLGSLTTLHLKNCGIGLEGAVVLAAELAKLKLLADLDIDNNGIEPGGANALAGALSGMSNMLELRIANNKIAAEGIKALAGPIQNMKSLRVLSLSNNEIGPIGAIALSSALPCLSRLATLDISRNDIGGVGAEALASAIGKLGSLAVLDIHNNKIGPIGTKALAAELAYAKSLATLRMSLNSMGSEGAKALANAIALGMANLAVLDISGNDIGNEGAQVIGKVLGELKKLSTLDVCTLQMYANDQLAYNNLSKEEEEKLVRLIGSNPK